MADSLSPNYVRLSWQGRHSTIRFDLSSDRPFPADAYAEHANWHTLDYDGCRLCGCDVEWEPS